MCSHIQRKDNKLTADVDTTVECLRNLRVHLNEELLLLGELFVTTCNLILHPGFEWCTQNGIRDIDQPLAGNFMHVPVIWKIVTDPWVLLGCLEYTLNTQVLILWHIHDFDIIAVDATGGSVTWRFTYYLRFPMTRSLRK